ncbi:MAG: anion permease [Clostridia bacterium]|nr:anion permease [Clostridia bacterium]
MLSLTCFFSSAFITNDVALITFVPFSIALLKKQGAKTLIFAVTLETVAANLGSLLTPIGNPQNLFLYSFYSMSIGDFFKITLPLGTICLTLVCILCVFRKNRPLANDTNEKSYTLKKMPLLAYAVLFVMAILSVLGIIRWYVSLATVLVFTLIYKKELILKADYILLFTFICFFIFVGNVARIDTVSHFVTNAIHNREMVFSALISQFISNVPAAAMLSSFTDNAKALIIGTNIGGLGTIIASMASLISYRYISKTEDVKASRYLICFSAVNFSLLLLLISVYTFI